MNEPLTAEQALPLGCHLGIWHLWGHWHDYAEGDVEITHLPADKTVTTGKVIIQQRLCMRCNAVQLRSARS